MIYRYLDTSPLQILELSQEPSTCNERKEVPSCHQQHTTDHNLHKKGQTNEQCGPHNFSLSQSASCPYGTRKHMGSRMNFQNV